MSATQPWTIRDLSFAGVSPKTVTITDLDNAGREIELLQFFQSASGFLNLTSTGATAIRAFGGQYNFQLGAARYDGISFNTDQQVSVFLPAGGRIGRLSAFSESGVGPRDIMIAGRAELVRLDEGDNAVTVAEGGRIETLRAFTERAAGTVNRIVVDGRIDHLQLFEGPSTVTVGGAGRVNYLFSDGALDLRATGGGRVQDMRVDRATAFVETQDGNIGSFSGFSSRTTLRLGAGGINQLTINGDGGAQDVQIAGFAGMINVMNGNALTLKLGAGGAGMVRATATGDHRIETGVGFVNGIQTGPGADVVVIGTGGVGMVHGGSGDDRFVFLQVDPRSVARAAGGLGVDTADFRRLGFGVRVDLGDAAFQNPGALSGGAMGPVKLESIENLIGTAFDDVLIGDAGDNLLFAGPGRNTLDGGAGFDTAMFTGPREDYVVARSGRVVFVAEQRRTITDAFESFLAGAGGAAPALSVDQLIDIEALRFADGDVAPPAAEFDALGYLAANTDLIGLFGSDVGAATLHFVTSGFLEGRPVRFDALSYIASHRDLADIFGANEAAGAAHFVQAGFFEGRGVSFDPLGYLARNADLVAAFGEDGGAAAIHFITFGRFEGRATSFDGLAYLASHADLRAALGVDAAAATLHFIRSGRVEGRTITFDALDYLAANSDLVDAFGLDARLATLHFLRNGADEGRSTVFDALDYIASHPDLIMVFGADPAAGRSHWLANGRAEGRIADRFDEAAYLALNSDVAAAGVDPAEHFIRFGFFEGRGGGPEF